MFIPSQIVRAQLFNLYDNSVNSLEQSHGPSVEFGDQVILNTGALPSAQLDRMTFQYSLSGGASGNLGDEQARIRLYANDGPDNKPGTLLFDTGAFNIVSTTGSGSTIQLSGLNATVSQTFTWTILFSGVEGTESAGLALYSPPVVGNNFTDYWERNGTDWTLKTIAGKDASFGAAFTGIAVPEPASIAWLSVYAAVACGFILLRRLRRS